MSFKSMLDAYFDKVLTHKDVMLRVVRWILGVPHELEKDVIVDSIKSLEKISLASSFLDISEMEAKTESGNAILLSRGKL